MADADNVYAEAEPCVVPDLGRKDGPVELQHPERGDDAVEQMDEFLGPNQDYNEEEEERKYYRRKRLGVVKNVVAASVGGMLTYSVYLGLLQMQLVLHYDETYREVKYGSLGLEDIDRKMLMGINVTPTVAFLYTPVLIRFLGTKWMMFLASGIYALFVSTNYWERYYTLVPSAVAIGAAIVPLWASLGNYITRMAQQYYEFDNYKEEHVQEQKKAPKGACHRYIIIFQSIFYSVFHLSFVFAEFPMVFFLDKYLYSHNHTLFNVKQCGATSVGVLTGLNRTVLYKLPRSLELIVVESVLMGGAFIAMVTFLALCGSAYRPTEEIDLRSIGWGNIFQLPFKHLRDYRLRFLCPAFIYSGLELLFAITGLTLCYGVCSLGLKAVWGLVGVYGLSASLSSFISLSLLRFPRSVLLLGGAGLHLILIIALFAWSPIPKDTTATAALYVLVALWGVGTAMNKTGMSIILGMLYEDKERVDFVFTLYHWCQAMAIFIVYLWASLPMRAKLSILLVTLLVMSLCYWLMERRLSRKDPFRLPRIPRPRHKVKGYRYLEEENSDESESEKSDAEELPDGEDRDNDSHTSYSLEGEERGGRGRRRRRDYAYEQAGEGEEYVQPEQ
ncbi:protein unc-93 homolog B1 isoform X2 [Amia ocellicauda]|uniref:protein unc-93 homolog B1 isoform X2 n=1 Tax=Amia ocellicauda TaxID=2972642 RepID=UPI0034638E12